VTLEPASAQASIHSVDKEKEGHAGQRKREQGDRHRNKENHLMVRTSIVHLMKSRYLECYGGSGYQDFNMRAYQIKEIWLLCYSQQGAI